jgi:hypothetical protein
MSRLKESLPGHHRTNIGFRIFAIASAVVNNTPINISGQFLWVLFVWLVKKGKKERGGRGLPPLITVLDSLIMVPRQNARMPPSFRILVMASTVVVAFADWDRVLMVSKGWVARVVMRPVGMGLGVSFLNLLAWLVLRG